MCPNQIPSEFSSRLSAWFQNAARVLPWRTKGQRRDPYRVWVSEIMLQQTRVSAVIGYFERFMAQFPTVSSLAAAPEHEVLKLWEGLGYYSRAKNLHKAAKLIEEKFGGEFPSDFLSIRSLPGIGDYTAGTIAAICFNLPCPSVDGNILRVITRVTASFADIAKVQTRKLVHDLLYPLYQSLENRGELTEALMELGALICVPNGAPKCCDCPVSPLCRAFRGKLTDQIPVKSKKPARVKEHYTVFIIESNGCFAVRKRPDSGLLAGLWEFVNCEGALNESEAASFLSAHGVWDSKLIMMKHVSHIFTHKEWDMRVYYLVSEKMGQIDCAEWRRLSEITLPSAFKKLID